MGKFKYGVPMQKKVSKHPDCRVMDAGACIEMAWPKPPSKEALKPKPVVKVKRFMADLRKAGLFRIAKIMAIK